MKNSITYIWLKREKEIEMDTERHFPQNYNYEQEGPFASGNKILEPPMQ